MTIVQSNTKFLCKYFDDSGTCQTFFFIERLPIRLSDSERFAVGYRDCDRLAPWRPDRQSIAGPYGLY